jgi:hypothetical protein
MAIDPSVEAAMRAKFEALLPHLDERAVRIVLAAEARTLGREGIAVVSRASGVPRSRIRQGDAELDSDDGPKGSRPVNRGPHSVRHAES